jgi:ATP synthase protein I
VSTIDLPHARRLAFGVVLGQAGATAALALAAWGLADRLAACSALIGGGIATVASLAMVGLAFGGAAAGSVQGALKAFYRGEAAKLALVVVLFAAVLKWIRVAPLAMFVAFALTLLVYWVALLCVLQSTGGVRGSEQGGAAGGA